MKEHKVVMNITKKLNNTSRVKYRNDMNMTEKLSGTFTKEH